MKPALILATLVAALGGLLFGFDTAVISGTTDWLRMHYALSNSSLGLTVATALIGTIVGSLLVGKPADRYGRRGVLVVLAALFLISSFGCALAWGWTSFVIFRFIGGLGVGGASVVSPMYVAEISPARYRGRLVAITQLNIVLGILFAYASNYAISTLDLGDVQYRWMFGVQAIPSALFLILLFFIPQTPRWLVARGSADAAREVLAACGADAEGVEREMAEIRESLDVEHHSIREPLFRRAYLTPILLAMAIAMFNQLSGINAIMYYTAHIFKMAGASSESALLQSVIIGLTNLVFTVAALALIDKLGRRVLMIAGSIGYILSLGATAWAFRSGLGGNLVLLSLIAFIASHAFGQGAVIWVFISEIFPNRVRARGQALGTLTHWVMCAAITWTFPQFAALAGWRVFAFFAVCCVGQLVWVLTCMPETKGISLEQIQKKLGIA